MTLDHEGNVSLPQPGMPSRLQDPLLIGQPTLVPCPTAESGSVEILDTLAFLMGTWNLDRSIEDHRSGIGGSFAGKAALVKVEPNQRSVLGERARYDEEGELRFGTHVGPASRRLGYRQLNSGAAMLHFADGRPFADLDLRSGAWRSVHSCGDDRYEITTIVRSCRVVQENWRVRGPSKAYEAATTLVRVD